MSQTALVEKCRVKRHERMRKREFTDERVSVRVSQLLCYPVLVLTAPLTLFYQDVLRANDRKWQRSFIRPVVTFIVFVKLRRCV